MTSVRMCNSNAVGVLTVLAFLAILQGHVLAQQARSAAPAADESWKEKFAAESAKWKQYSLDLRSGKSQEAGRVLKNLESSFPSDQARDEFWSHVLPAGRRQTIQLLRVCQACIDGRCKGCGGVGVCPTCRGERKCLQCKGVGVKRSACSACLCPECKGTGFCGKCLSRKYFPCTKCDGRGYDMEAESTPCAKCGGAGKVSGGFNNDVMRTCSACGGKGQFDTKKRIVCPVCQGRKAVACTACNGSGLCPTCQGKKRTGGCAACGDTRTVSSKCSLCGGTGSCPDCVGKPVCAKCGGRGVCLVCERAKLLSVITLPADSTWMNYTNVCVVQTAANYLVDGAVVPSLGGNSTCGVIASAGIENMSRGRVPLRLVSHPGEVICISDREETDWLAGTLFKLSY